MTPAALPFAISILPKGWTDPVTNTIKGLLHTAFSGGLELIGSWVMAGAAAALKEIAHMIGATTSPDLASSAFAGTYLRVSALAVTLTLPFLFAAVIQSVLRGDMVLLVRSAFMSLPIALIGLSLIVPIISLLLSVTDWMCDFVSAGAINSGSAFLLRVANDCAFAGGLTGSSFMLVFLAALTVFAALALTVELLVREVAVYVVVLMLPLAFAAMVWPARRIWALRMLELLLALILSKFVIVAVLTLAGALLSDGSSVSQLLSAMSLILLSCFSPWMLMRLLPFAEVAAHAADAVHQGHRDAGGTLTSVAGAAAGVATGNPALLSALGDRSGSFGSFGDSSGESAADGDSVDWSGIASSSTSPNGTSPNAAQSYSNVDDDELEVLGSDDARALGAGGPTRALPAPLDADDGGGGPSAGTGPDNGPAGSSSSGSGARPAMERFDWDAGTVNELPPESAPHTPTDGIEAQLRAEPLSAWSTGLGPDTSLISGDGDDEDNFDFHPYGVTGADADLSAQNEADVDSGVNSSPPVDR